MKALRLLLLVSLPLWGCGGDPEAQSGADAYRHQAAEMALDEWVTDDIALDEGDRTDWKKLVVPGAGTLTLQVHVDAPDAELLVGVFSRYGEPLGEVVRGANAGRARVDVAVRDSGHHFLMVRQKDGPPTSYMLRASMGGADDGGSSPRPGF